MLALARYEGGIERGLYKALHELQRLQAARQGAVVPVPQVVDAIISGDGVESGDEGEVIGFVPSYPGTEIRAPGTTTRESKT